MSSSASTLKEAKVKAVIFRVFRFDPTKDEKPYFKEYEITLAKGMTVLEALIYIKEKIDPTLSFRASCRMGVCGSCAMYINGKPRLACYNQVEDLRSNVISVAPLPNYPVIKDLVPDLTPLFQKHASVKPFIIRPDREEMENPTGQFLMTPHQLEDFIQFAYCIKCGACLSACPTVASDPAFLGPQALAQAYRYIADCRDAGAEIRIKILDTAHGPFRCHFAGACTDACPKGVDPALGIQYLKKHMFFGKKQKPSGVKPLAKEHVPNEKYPAPPERTVK